MSELSTYGLEKCRRCHRILTAESLEKNRCRPGLDCEAHRLLRLAWEDGHPDAIAFARSVERGLLEAAGLVPGEDGLTEGARELVESFELAI